MAVALEAMDTTTKQSTKPGGKTLTKYKPMITCAVTGLLLFLGITLMISGILVIYLYNDFIDGMIESEIRIQPGTQLAKTWVDPPITPHLKLYYFNVTNPVAFAHKGAKPNLKEVGPYTYRETWKKVNVSWVNNGQLIEYDLRKTYEFVPELSVGTEEDVLSLVNIPMVAAAGSLKYAGKFVKLALGSLLEILEQELVVSLSVKNITWGYEHQLIQLGKDILPKERRYPHEKFGLFAGRNGTTNGLMRIFTGLTDVQKIGQVASFNGRRRLDIWNGPGCNAINGTDGSMFHPNILKNETLHIFNKDLCQSLPIVYDEDVEMDGIPAYRFVPPTDAFDNKKPSHDCFCMADPSVGCSVPNGVFNMSACQYGSPVMLSWPHFFQADPVLRNAVNGLQPDKEKHQTYIDVQPRLGNALRASIKSQINLHIYPVEGIKKAVDFKDMIMPVAWFETQLEGIEDEAAVSAIRSAVFLPAKAKNGLFVLCFLGGPIALLLAAAIIAYTKWGGFPHKMPSASDVTRFVTRFKKPSTKNGTSSVTASTTTATATATSKHQNSDDSRSSNPPNKLSNNC